MSKETREAVEEIISLQKSGFGEYYGFINEM
jgi:hypothetical protein